MLQRYTMNSVKLQMNNSRDIKTVLFEKNCQTCVIYFMAVSLRIIKG